MPEESSLQLQAEETAKVLAEKLIKHSITLSLAESCTAGLVSSLLGNFSGISSVLWGTFVCYTQQAKVSMLGLDNEKLTANGLVNKETACDMALGALKKSGTDLAAAVTGIAGPHGDGSTVPVGTVWIAACKNGVVTAKEFHFTGSRNEVRLKAAIAVLEMIDSFVKEYINTYALAEFCIIDFLKNLGDTYHRRD